MAVNKGNVESLIGRKLKNNIEFKATDQLDRRKAINDFKDSLDKLNIQLCKILNSRNVELNSFPLIDFTTVSHYNSKSLRAVSQYRFTLSDYKKKLKKFFEINGYSFPDYQNLENSLNGKPYVLKEKGQSQNRQEEIRYDFFDSGIEQIDKISGLDKWNLFIEQQYHSQVKSCLTFFKKFSLTDLNEDNEYIEIGIYLLSNKVINQAKADEIIEILKPFIFTHGNKLIIQENYRKHKITQKSLRNTSLKSSLAAVMARTQSHNTGSHVLSRISNTKEFDVDNIVRDFETAQFISPFSEKDYKEPTDSEWQAHYKEFKEKEVNRISSNNEYVDRWNEIAKQELPDTAINLLAKQQVSNERMAIFNSYIKARQELMAEIVTTQASFFNTVNFKDDVLKFFSSNHILLDRISGIENFKYTIRFDNQVSDGDLPVAIANDTLGKQALYIILENIIRNTAKHASKLVENNELPEQIVFTIRAKESSLNPDYYQITIFDSVKVKENIMGKDNNDTLSCSDDEYNTYYKDHCTSSDQKNIFKLKKLIIDQNRLINEKIIDDSNQLRTYALGLIEMEACACYLRGLDLTEMDKDHFELKFSKKDREELKSDIEDGKRQLRILRNVNPLNKEGLELLNSSHRLTEEELSEKLAAYENRENCLAYQFYLPKPKELLVCVKDEDLQANETLIKNASKNGITIVHQIEPDKIYTETNLLSFSKIPEGIKMSFLPKRQLNLTKKEDITTKDNLLRLLKNQEFNELKEDVLTQLVISKSKDKKIYPVYKGIGDDLGSILNNEKYGFDRADSFKELPLIYDDHGTHYSYNETGSILQIKTNREKDFFPKINFDEDDEKIENINLRFNYLDSALNNIVVLDERIQEQAYNRYSLLDNKTRTQGVSYRELWYNQGCYIPTKQDIDLSHSNFSGYEDRLKALFKNINNGKLYLEAEKEGELKRLISTDEKLILLPEPIYKGIDTIIIHIGVVEKILEANGKDKKNPDDIKEFFDALKNWSKGSKENSSLDIILTSGRAPKHVNPEYGFAGISVIMPHIIDQRFKHNLHQLILNIRPKNL